MLRITAICLLLALGGTALAQTPQRPALKGAATVEGPLVHIGDLIEHAGALAEVAIFRSPDPGHTGSVAVASVLEALRPHGLTEVDTRGFGEIVVSRASRAVTPKEIESAIVGALSGQRGLGAAADLSPRIDQTLRTIHLEASATGALQVTRLGYDPRRRRFDITFDLAGSVILKRTPLHLTGTVVETGEYVTIVRAIRRGEIVTRGDVAIERRPRNTIGGDVLLRTDAALGMAVRRMLRAGEPLRQADLMRPELVRRDDTVTLTYQVPGMLLTVRGKALQAGAEGETVSVLNLQSKRTVHGTVAGPGRVSVAVPVIRLASAARSVPSTTSSPPDPARNPNQLRPE
jgi:flagella basal body P-ring formation protein FlgA